MAVRLDWSSCRSLTEILTAVDVGERMALAAAGGVEVTWGRFTACSAVGSSPCSS